MREQTQRSTVSDAGHTSTGGKKEVVPGAHWFYERDLGIKPFCGTQAPWCSSTLDRLRNTKQAGGF